MEQPLIAAIVYEHTNINLRYISFRLLSDIQQFHDFLKNVLWNFRTICPGSKFSDLAEREFDPVLVSLPDWPGLCLQQVLLVFSEFSSLQSA